MQQKGRSLSSGHKNINIVEEVKRLRKESEHAKYIQEHKEKTIEMSLERPRMMVVYKSRQPGSARHASKNKNATQLSIAKQLDQFRQHFSQITQQSSANKNELEDGTVLSVCRTTFQRKPDTAVSKARSNFSRRSEQRSEDVSIVKPMSVPRSAEQSRPKEEPYETKNCYEIDFSFLDDMKPDETKMRKMLTDNFWMQKKLDLDQFVEDNKDYLLHQFCQCACARCTCTKCQCIYMHQRPNQLPKSTTYLNSFTIPHTEMNNLDPLNQTHYQYLQQVANQNHLQPEHPTLHSRTYKEPPLQPRFRRKYRQLIHNPFLAKTLKQHHFPDWQDYDPTWVFKRPPHNSVVEGFQQNRQTLYKDTFCKTQYPITPNHDAKYVKDLQAHQTFIRPSPDIKDTLYQTSYQNYNIKDVPNTYLPFKFKTETETYEPIDSYQGQFKNSHNQWYRVPPKAAKTIQNPWKHKLVQYLQQVHTVKQP